MVGLSKSHPPLLLDHLGIRRRPQLIQDQAILVHPSNHRRHIDLASETIVVIETIGTIEFDWTGPIAPTEVSGRTDLTVIGIGIWVGG